MVLSTSNLPVNFVQADDYLQQLYVHLFCALVSRERLGAWPPWS